MLFNSVQFLIFFVIVASAYYALPQRGRVALLLLASYYFYMCWEPIYVLLLLLSTLIDYLVALLMEKTKTRWQRRKYLWLSLCVNLGMLFTFKYFDFFIGSMETLLQRLHVAYHLPSLRWLLPVGISFYTFQTLGYVIDVYRGDQKAERNFARFALYVAFFPQLVAGPIERAGNLLPQFSRHVRFNYQETVDGLKLMLWGLFKKAVVADRLALFVDQVYNNVYDYQGWPLVVATVFFAFQIYCDFSGYSDIAVGAAQVFGIRLMDNFNRPYFAKSVAEFWKRWHISLTSWFKDYVYIPLGGNRVGPLRWYLNIFIVFLISGLWHGASWTFAVWGALNGMYLLMSIWTKKWRCHCVKALRLYEYPVIHKYVKVAITFLLICFSWIFFRANNISEAGYIVTHLLRGLSDPHMRASLFDGFGLGFKSLLVALAATMFMETVHLLQRHQGIRHMLAGQPAVLRLTVYTVMVMSIFLFGNFHAQPFIYFQF